jgi:hypothetical protein
MAGRLGLGGSALWWALGFGELPRLHHVTLRGPDIRRIVVVVTRLMAKELLRAAIEDDRVAVHLSTWVARQLIGWRREPRLANWSCVEVACHDVASLSFVS